MQGKPSIKIVGGTFLAISIILLYASKTPQAGWLFIIPTLFIFGTILGTWLFPTWQRAERVFTGTGLLIAWIAVLGSLFFYLWKLDVNAIALITLSFGSLLFVKIKKPAPDEQVLQNPSLGIKGGAWHFIGLVTAYGLFIVALARMLTQSATTISIRSPWEVLPKEFLLVFFLAVLALILIIKTTRAKFAMALGIPLLFLTFAITFFIYPIGYGFDSFIHHATETHIIENGTITPKPFSYIGQYALVSFLHQHTGLSVELADRLLLPIILIFFVLFALRRGLLEGFKLQWRAATLGTILLPIIPFTQWIVTTPQGLGNVFTLFAVALTLNKKFKPSIGAALATAAALVTHPISGMPAVILFAFTILNTHIFKKIKIGLQIFLAILSSFAVTILFWLYGIFTGQSLLKLNNLNFNSLYAPLQKIIPQISHKFSFWDDFIYLFGQNLIPIAIIAAILIWILMMRKKQKIGLLIAVAIITVVNAALLLLLVDFSYLPLTEQTGYVARLAGVGLIFLIPIILSGVVFLLWQTDKLGKTLGLGVIILIAGIATTSLYLSYPHQDAYTTERGWSVSEADLEAVYFINSNAGSKDFIVLSNQSVSAIALQEFGFKKYYPIQSDGKQTETFYYPIPTGGPLYKYFYDASYGAPIRETVTAAMENVGVDLAYFVVDNYWWKADKLVERAKQSADAWIDIGDGQVHVFKYEKKK